MIHVVCNFAIAPDAEVVARHSVSVFGVPLIARINPSVVAAPVTVASYEAAIFSRRVAPEVFSIANTCVDPSEIPALSGSSVAVNPVD